MFTMAGILGYQLLRIDGLEAVFWFALVLNLYRYHRRIRFSRQEAYLQDTVSLSLKLYYFAFRCAVEHAWRAELYITTTMILKLSRHSDFLKYSINFRRRPSLPVNGECSPAYCCRSLSSCTVTAAT
jgi:hypothetical protein